MSDNSLANRILAATRAAPGISATELRAKFDANGLQIMLALHQLRLQQLIVNTAPGCFRDAKPPP
jgi:hypothetical protein